MRPKKVILLYDPSEQSLGVRRYLLENKGYRVLAPVTAAQALEWYRERAAFYAPPQGLSLVISVGDLDLIRRMKAIYLDVPAILLCSPAYPVPDGVNVALETRCQEVTLLEHIRQWTALKRGPRKKHTRAEHCFICNGCCKRAAIAVSEERAA